MVSVGLSELKTPPCKDCGHIDSNLGQDVARRFVYWTVPLNWSAGTLLMSDLGHLSRGPLTISTVYICDVLFKGDVLRRLRLAELSQTPKCDLKGTYRTYKHCLVCFRSCKKKKNTNPLMRLLKPENSGALN